jgi:Trk K+ transport system NAD-binding subunit
VVVIEQDRERARLIQDAMDALVIEGNGASLATLEQAGIAGPTCCWRSPARTRST